MGRTLSEADSKQLLRQHGVPVLDERVAPDPDSAAQAADAIGYQVVASLLGYADDMIDDLVTQRLFGPFRGEPPIDRDRLVDVLVGLSDAAVANPDVVSADVNPLIVVDGVPVAVDALVELKA